MRRRKVYNGMEEIPCDYLGDWLTKLERRAFGWEISDRWENYEDEEVNLTFDYEKRKGRISRSKRSEHYMVFNRDYPYTSNIIFNIFDTLSKFISSIRRPLLPVFAGISFMAGIVGLFEFFGNGQFSPTWGIVLIFWVAFITPSLVLALLGWGTRKIFRIGE